MTNEPLVTDHGRSQAWAWTVFIMLAVIWGCSFLLIKNGLGAFTSVQVGSLRIAVACLCVLPMGLNLLRTIPIKLWWPFALSGLMGNLLPSLLFSVAGAHIPSSISGCLNAFTPMFTMLLGLIIYKHKINNWQLLGLTAGLFGALLLASTKGRISLQDINPYAGAVLLATLMYAVNVNYLKYKLAGHPAEKIAFLSLTLAGTPALGLLAFDADFHTRLADVGLLSKPFVSVVLLGVLGSFVGTLFFNRLIKMTSAVFASSVTYCIPFVAVLIGLIQDEPFGILQGGGLLATIFGVYLVNKKKV